MNTFSELLNSEFSSDPHTLIARLNESDFFVVIPSNEPFEIMERTEKIMNTLRTCDDD